MENRGKKKAYRDKTKVFLPTDKGSVMVVTDKKEIMGGKDSYEAKMKPVLEDLKSTLLIRAGETWRGMQNYK